MKLAYAPPAQRELLDAVAWYRGSGGPDVAERFDQAVNRALHLLSAMPMAGTPRYPSVRLWPVSGFPYTLVYRLRADELTVIAVAHQSRAPGYWQGRS